MFTVLIAGVCGYLNDIQGEPFVTIGYIQGKECVRPVLTIANGVTTLPTRNFRHPVHVEIGDTEAVVTIDQKTFRIPRN
jgi:hypothetical protein